MTISRRFDWSTTNKKLHATQETLGEAAVLAQVKVPR